jgi:nicotinate dehydrogenase subunit B
MSEKQLTRRQLLGNAGFAAGGLVIGFALGHSLLTPKPAAAPKVVGGGAEAAPAAVATGTPPTNQIDAWLNIGRDGSVTVYSGKVELGTGVQTALAQIVAEELDVPFARVSVIMGDTAKTPDQSYTAGSQTLQVAGPQLRKAAAAARQVLLGLAAERLGVPVSQLTVQDGVVRAGSKQVSYGDLVGGERLYREIPDQVPVKSPAAYKVVGTSVPRVDIPGKVTGAFTYMQDVKVDGMLHGRVVRPAGVGATLDSIDESSVANIPGLVKVVRLGNFVGVVAQEEWQAIQAANQLKVTWKLPHALPKPSDLYGYLTSQKTVDKTIDQKGDVDAALKGAAKTVSATYTWPYQAHASIGPSCAIADVGKTSATIWSSTQGVYQLRDALAKLLGLPPDSVRVIYVEGSGCYGHNGFDDVAADAALLSRAVGKPVRVQWMRGDEFAWEPKGPAMQLQLRGAVASDGTVAAWDFQSWTPTHSTRPGGMPGNLLAGQLMSPPAPPANNPFVGGDRNAPVNYEFGNRRVTVHWVPQSPLRPSALRSLGGAANTFANESFMDELAAAAGADPVEFRLRHLKDPRAVAVIQAAAKLANWQSRPSPAPGKPGKGRGIAFSRYENNLAYVATVAEVTVDTSTGVIRVDHLYIAHDCGQIVNPDGLRNQIEGNAIQSTSRALKEQVTFDQDRVTSVDWASYPILTFPEVPQVDIALIDHPDQPIWGAGEIATEPTAAAIANAVFDATGIRLRSVPFTPDRVKAAL